MGRKKKSDNGDSPTEPWLDDPYDNTIPWGAPQVSVKEIADEIDKAPPYSYFKEKVEDLKTKVKRKRRKKCEWHDQLKDPIKDLKLGLEFLKNRKPGYKQGSEKVHLEKDPKNNVDVSGFTKNKKINAEKKTSKINNVKDINLILKGIESKLNNISSKTKPHNNLEGSAIPFVENETAVTASISNEEITNNKVSITSESQINSTEQDNAEKDEISNPIFKSPMGKQMSITILNNDTINENESFNSVKLDASEKNLKDDSQKPLNFRLNSPIEIVSSPSTIKENETKDELRVKGNENILSVKGSSAKEKVTTAKCESSKSTSVPDLREEKSREKTSNKKTKKKHQSLKNKRRPILDYETANNFNYFEDLGDNSHSPGISDRSRNISDCFFEERDGELHFPNRSAHGRYAQEDVYSRSSFPLDSKSMRDKYEADEQLNSRYISSFLNSTLQPGDGYVLNDSREQDVV